MSITIRTSHGLTATLDDDGVWTSPTAAFQRLLRGTNPVEDRGPSDPDPIARTAREAAADWNATIVEDTTPPPTEPEDTVY